MSSRPAAPFLPIAIAGFAFLAALASTASAQCSSGSNSALAFDGNDWVRIAGTTATSLDGFQDFTIETWYQLDPGANDVALLCKSHPSAPFSYCVRVSATSGTFFFGLTSGGFSQFTFPLPPVPTGAWRHLAVARGGGVLTVYPTVAFPRCELVRWRP